MPEWIQRIAACTPFPAMLTSPVEMLTTAMAPGRLAMTLALQAGWAVAAVAIALGVWRIGVRRFEGVGA